MIEKSTNPAAERVPTGTAGYGCSGCLTPDEIINISGVDTEKGLSLYGNELDIYLPVLHSFISNVPDVLDKLRTVSEETLPAYAINVHGLKGICAGIGAETTREAALNLEKMAKAGDLQGILAKNDILIKEAENIIANIKAWLEKYDGEKPEK